MIRGKVHDRSGQDALDYELVVIALRSYVGQNAISQPSLNELAEHAQLSPSHFQRVFLRWAGVTPKRFLQFLTKEHAKKLLRNGASVLQTTHKTGLSSGSHLHDLLITTEVVTPGSYARGPGDLLIEWGIHPSPFGRALVACTHKGICSLSFVDTAQEQQEALARLKHAFPRAQTQENTSSTQASAMLAFSQDEQRAPLGLHLRGSNYQLRIWQALLEIPAGSLCSYRDLARRAGHPGSARAVGTAMAKNLIAYLIPCHRVIRAVGEIGQYHWGSDRKRALIAWESSALDL